MTPTDKSKILVISDIHGNREALQAVLDQEPSFDDLVFLGDAVSPSPQPVETIQLLNELPGVHICGNHDQVMLNPSMTENWPEPWKVLDDWVRSSLSPKEFEYLRKLQSKGNYKVGGRELHLCHGEYKARFRHLLPHSPIDDFLALTRADDADLVLFGHSHVQFEEKIGNKRFFNPGSVGQNRCGRPVACYGVIENGELYHRHVPYDTAPLIEALYSIEPLDEFPEFREWFGETLTSGFGVGKSEPWTTLADQGYM